MLLTFKGRVFTVMIIEVLSWKKRDRGTKNLEKGKLRKSRHW